MANGFQTDISPSGFKTMNNRITERMAELQDLSVVEMRGTPAIN